MGDKRSSARYAAKASLCFKPEGDSSKVIEGQLLNISHSGFSALLKENIDVDITIQFDLTADFTKEHLAGTGKIVYVVPQKQYSREVFMIGVKFIECDKDAVLLFISENQRMILQERQRSINEQTKRKQLGSTDFGPF
jgi:hypothetical protein